MRKATYGDLVVGRKSPQDSRSCFDGGSGGQQSPTAATCGQEQPQTKTFLYLYLCICHKWTRASPDRTLLRSTTAAGHRFNLRFHFVQSQSDSSIATNQNYRLKAFLKIMIFQTSSTRKREEKLYHLPKVNQSPRKRFPKRQLTHRSSQAGSLMGTVGALLLRSVAGIAAPAQLAGRRCPRCRSGHRCPLSRNSHRSRRSGCRSTSHQVTAGGVKIVMMSYSKLLSPWIPWHLFIQY